MGCSLPAATESIIPPLQYAFTMATTPRQQAIQMHDVHDRDEESRTAPVHEHSSLFHEIHETVRRLLQHVIFACLLTLRLYMLPLLYLSHKLTVRDDPWYFATWNIMLRPGRSMANCAQCHGDSGASSMIERWKMLKDNFCAPVRILKTLYALGQVIGEDPNALQPMPPSLLNVGPDSAIDVQSVEENTPKVRGSGSTDPAIEAPASASQIYHAALLNGNTLDYILAAFETSTPDSSTQAEHVITQQDPMPSRDNNERLTGPFKRHRYRDSSLHSQTHEAAFTQTLDDSLICLPEPRKVGQHLPQTPCFESPGKGMMESPCKQSDAQNQTRSVSSHHEYDFFKDQFEHKRTTSTEVGQCPTFMRRHNHSAIPKRRFSGDRKSLAALQERGTMSSPVLSSSSPTKRARLQRRVKVYDEDKV